MPPRPRPKRTTTADGRVSIAGKAANGEGSVYFEKSRNSWRATYWVAGDPKVRKVRGRTRAEAERKRDEAIAAAEVQRRVIRFTTSTTVEELAGYWLAVEAPQRLRAPSIGVAASRLSRERLGPLADVPVVDLTVEGVKAWQAGLLTTPRVGPKGEPLSPLSANMVIGCRSVLRTVIEEAVTVGLIGSNPVAKVRRPKPPERSAVAFRPDDMRRLVEACQGARYGAVVAVLFGCGWRVSEALGLAWSDLDLDAGTAHVQRAVVEVRGSGRQLGPPKTSGARGVHHLPPGVVEALRRHRVDQAAERLRSGVYWPEITYQGVPLDLVFRSESGGLPARQHVDKLIRAKCRELGLPEVGTHTGRRSVVTGLYLAGAPIEDIARHVGHASSSTTAGYVADLGERPKNIAELAGRVFDAG